MKRIFWMLPVVLALLFSLTACAGDEGNTDTPQETPPKEELVMVKDAYGFDREEGCWLTECLLLPEMMAVEELFGTGGESGLASEAAFAKHGQLTQQNSGYLVYLVYGTPGEGSVPQAYLQLSMPEAGQVLYDAACAELGEISCLGNVTATLDMSKPAAERLQVACEDTRLQGAVVIPITLRKTGKLYVDMWVRAEGVLGSSLVDELDEIGIGTAPATEATAEITSLSVRYLTEAAYANGNYAESAIAEALTFENGVCSYMVIDVGFSASMDSDGSRQLGVLLHMPGRGLLDINVEDAPTSATQKSATSDGMTISAAFTIPQTAGESKSVRMLVRLLPLSGGVSELGLYLMGDEKTAVTGLTHRTLSCSTGEPTVRYTLSKDGSYYTATSVPNPDITTIQIPDALRDGIPVTGIDPDLFDGLYSLEQLEIGNNVVMQLDRYSFSSSYSLKSVSIGNGVTQIGEGTFEEHTKLESVRVGTGVEMIGKRAFYGCTALRDVEMGNGVHTIDNSAFSNCTGLTRITIPEGVTTIGAGAFSGCKWLVDITIPEKVTKIGSNAFGGCIRLQSVQYNAVSCGSMQRENAFEGSGSGAVLTIGPKVQQIPGYIFEEFSGLRELVFDPDGVCERIGSYAFFHCEGLERAQIACTKTVENYAFAFCYGLQELTFTKGPEQFLADCFYLCQKLKSVRIGEGTTRIGYHAFASCTALETLTLPSTLKEISEGAFMACQKLESVTLPAGVTAIGAEAFASSLLLSSLSFEGSMAQWDQITKDKNWMNNTALSTVNCKDGEINLS